MLWLLASCEWLVSLGVLCGSVVEAGVWLLLLFSSSVQMEHQRNLGYGFHGHREPISFVRRVVIWGSVGLQGPSDGSFSEFLTVRRTLLLLVTIWYRGVCLPGVSEIQVILGRLLCVHVVL